MKNLFLSFIFFNLILISFSQFVNKVVDSDLLVLDLGNDTTVCFGEHVLLDAGSGYDSYLWQNGSTEQTYLVTEAGNYWVHAWLGSVMFADTITITMWPEPVPNLGEDQIVCFGEYFLLQPGAGFAYYLWMDGSNLPFYISNEPGVYWVTVTDIYGCTGSDTVVIFNPAYTVNLGNDTVICDYMTLQLDAGENFVSYSWQDGSTDQYYLIDGNVLGVGLFEFHCTAIDTINCESSDTINVYISECTDISEYYDDAIKIYPNPNDGKFVLDVSAIPEGIYNFTLSDSFGRVLKSEKAPIFNKREISTDFSYLSEGIYYLKLAGYNITINKKLLIR